MNPNDKPEQPEPSEAQILEILEDGTFMKVTFRDKSTEKVKVKKVAIRDMKDLGASWGKEPKELECYTGMSAQWVDRLTDESWNLLMEEGRRLNFTHFAAWWKRQSTAIAALGNDQMANLMQEATKVLLSQQNSSSASGTKTP